MSDHTKPPIFDGHNDVLLKLYNSDAADPIAEFSSGNDGHIDMPKVAKGGFGGGFFAIYVPTTDGPTKLYEMMLQPRYDIPLPDEIPQSEALPIALSQAATLVRMERSGLLKICVTTAEIRDCLQSGMLAAIMHMEGAEAIDPEFEALDIFYRAGLRSLGPVWSRPTIFGHGVPFRFPSSGDIGPGLTDNGKALISACNRRKILIDLSHLNEAGFWDVARISTAPLVATHSNTHALSNQSRNLTDSQLAAIKESDGVVGVNYATAFLRSDGQMLPDTGLDLIVRHILYLIDKLGDSRVALGSDFDGAMVPGEMKDAGGLGHLRREMQASGIDDTLMKKLCHENWLRVLGRTWGE